jgi:MFS family permease
MSKAETRRPLVLGCILMSLLMVAMEMTVAATAMPSIVAQLGGLALYSWVFTAFLLAQAGVTVIFGKLADIYGRRPVLIAGLGIFLVGSVLCGLSWSMESLIGFRLLQGLGAGSIMPVAYTLVGDLYDVRERATLQGWLGGVWAGAAVLGPLAGGFIVQQLSWPWVFWINVPIVILTVGGLLLWLHEDTPHRNHPLDVAGAALFFVAIAALLLMLSQLGAGSDGLVWAAVAGTVCLVTTPVFLRHESRAPEPMIDMGLWAQPFILGPNLSTFAAGMTFMGVTTYVPVYVQGVLGGSPTQAGLTIGAMSLGWPLAAFLARHVYRLIGMARTARLGSVLIVFGATGLAALPLGGGMTLAAVSAFVLGFGVGFVNNVCVLMVQSSVDWSQRGVATSSNTFSRNLGTMVGVALLGGVLNGALLLFSHRAGAGVDRVRHLLDHSVPIADPQAPMLRGVLEQATTMTFTGLVVLALLTAAAVWRLQPGALEEEFGR